MKLFGTDDHYPENMDSMPLTFRQKVNEAIQILVSAMYERYHALVDNPARPARDIEEGPSKTVACFKIFNHDQWPENRADLVDYGEEQLVTLVTWFKPVLERNGCNVNQIVPQWSPLKTLVSNEFKDKSFSGLWEMLLSKEPYKEDFEAILHLVRIMLVIPVSSAQCERTISAVNRIKSDVRSCLDPTTVECLIRVSSEGPPIVDLDTRPFIEKWFETKRKLKYRGWPNQIQWDVE